MGTGALAGDSDADGDSLTIASVAGSAANVGQMLFGTYGELTLKGNGAYSYVADQGLAIVEAANGSPIRDVFADTVSDGHGGITPSTLTLTVSLGAGGAETVNNPTGSSTYTIGATALTLAVTRATTFSGVIQDGSSGNVGGSVVVQGSAPLTLTGAQTYTGHTQVYGTLDLSGAGSVADSRNVALKASGAVFDISGASAAESIGNLVGTTGIPTIVAESG